MHQLADLLERSVELRREVVGAVIDPLMIAGLIAASVVILIAFVLPRVMKPIMNAPNVEMPLPTMILMDVSDFIKAWWLVLIGAGVLAWIAWRNWLAKPANRLRFDTFVLRLPVAGQLVRDIAVARFTRTLGTLVLQESRFSRHSRSARHARNTALTNAIDQVSDKVTTGQSLADPLERSGHFPPLLVQIVNIGERSGRLEADALACRGKFRSSGEQLTQALHACAADGAHRRHGTAREFRLAAILLPIVQSAKLRRMTGVRRKSCKRTTAPVAIFAVAFVAALASLKSSLR
jgi:general secretion pathway protein F